MPRRFNCGDQRPDPAAEIQRHAGRSHRHARIDEGEQLDDRLALRPFRFLIHLGRAIVSSRGAGRMPRLEFRDCRLVIR